MLLFDQLKKNDPHLRLLAIVVFAGMCVLAAGLWWVQIVSSRDYQANLEFQSYRTVRVPAVRGRILDRNGEALAENRPVYSVSLYLEELRKEFDRAGAKEVTRVRNELNTRMAAYQKSITRKLTAEERKQFSLDRKQRDQLFEDARYVVASNVVAQIGGCLQQPLSLDPTGFDRHYNAKLFLPFPVVRNMDPNQIARFEEWSATPPGVDLEVQSARVYPYKTTAAHLLGRLSYDDSSAEGEDAFFWYRLPDYRGVLGVEYAADSYLRGQAGAKAVLVNHRGFRQTENFWSPTVPGTNVILTIDLQIQQATERALENADVGYKPVRGAAVVMDVNNGNILALASAPTYDLNSYGADYQKIQAIAAEKNRATQENYRPGSIFKTIVALACLENGLDPHEIYRVLPNPKKPTAGIIYIGRNQSKEDTAPPGLYDFVHALIHSSNAYFIYHGLKPGVIDRVVEIGARLHLGQPLDLGTRQETRGTFPDEKRIKRNWSIGDTANLSIGQGLIDITPVHMAVLASALANGGKVLWPRVIQGLELQDPNVPNPRIPIPARPVRDQLGVSARSLQILKDAMLADVEDPEGGGKHAHIDGFPICAKTGTAQNERGGVIDRSDYTTWFLSFAPYQNPRYAVVVMVERGSSGGGTCAPIAKDIYMALLERERAAALRNRPLARTN